MAITKPTTLTLRIDPVIEKEHRSLTNMVEVMIRDLCKQHNVVIPEQLSLLPSNS